jgi:tetratricopeptide (TPR) repeat protein
VCGIPGDTTGLDVLGGLERLAEQSLLSVGEDLHGDMRFTMLETIREFALEKLEERSESAALRDRHAEAFLAFATASDPPSLDTTTAAAAHARQLDRLEDEHDNLRAALEHLTATGKYEDASALAFALWRFWQMRGHLAEGRARVDRVLAMPQWPIGPMPQWPLGPSRARLRALEAAGGLAYWSGDLVATAAHYGAAVELARTMGDDAELANALYNQFFARRPTGSASEWILTMRDGDTALLDESLAIWTRLGDEHGMGRALWGLAEWYGYRREFDRAEDASSRALEIFERIGDPFWVSWSRFTRSFGRVLRGDRDLAAADLGPTLREFWVSRDVSGVALLLSTISSLLLLDGRGADGYAVGGAALRVINETGTRLATLWPSDDVPMPDPETTDPTLRAALATGAAWSRDEAVDRAIALCDDIARGVSAAS